MCAIEAGKRGHRVALLERSDRPGKKILISGGGRCNFTNLRCGPENFYSANPHFAKSALARYPPSEFISLVETHGIRYHEKTLGQLFCDRSALDIVTMLECECRAAGVETFLNQEIQEIRRADEFIVMTSSAEFRAPALIVATGGLSIPKIGATSLGYDIARQFGLKIRDPRPALVPLLLSNSDRAKYCDLAGVSADVEVSAGGDTFREKMLITHRGLSGPAMLQISTAWRENSPIRVDLAPGRDATVKIRESSERNIAVFRTALQQFLPKRFAARWLDLHMPTHWTNRALEDLEQQIHGWIIEPAGTEGYEKAEVTAGGVDTDELSSKTMESRSVPGLFFIGEVVDVTGQLGGYNFQWAWASGAAAGRAL
jgi:predicted Rossmann fold flavoprotein